MERTFRVEVDKNTWPGKGMLPVFPPEFHSGSSLEEFKIQEMLLLIGYLTTPTSSKGVSLSEFWAWVRYLAAVTNEPELRLTRSFSELDAHQKTILSDDFGVGLSMLWLTKKLGFNQIIDGRYFMKRVAVSAGATQRRMAKRGPNKTPDFVARDANGIWHVVECKGTQSGIEYSDRQIGNEGPPLKGGVAQKRSIIFPPNYTGQRLVCGLSIGLEDESTSRLRIVDPKPEEPFEVSLSQVGFASDAISRGVASKTLRLAGFETIAEATASPFGVGPDTMRSHSRVQEEAREQFVRERAERARDELDPFQHKSIFNSNYSGREIIINLPRNVDVGGAAINKVILKQGVNKDFLEMLREEPTLEEANFGEKYKGFYDFSDDLVTGDDRSASMRVGNFFRSDIILE